MDAQLKRGMLDACVLKVLCNGKSYGYQVIKDLSICVEISESTLYPILRRLEASKCLVVSSEEHNGRLRKYYEITSIGRKEFVKYKESIREAIDIYNFILQD